MDSFLRILHRTPLINALLLLVYIPLSIFAHDPVQDLFLWLQQTSPSSYRWVINTAAGVTLGVVTIWILAHIRRGLRRDVKLAYWILSLAAVAVSYYYLVAVGSETIHYLQYALLVVPLYAFTASYRETFLWATLISLIDEGYQYWWLKRDWGIYFDFNDLVLNQVGALLGLVIIFSTVAAAPLVAERLHRPPPRTLGAPALLISLALLIAGLAMSAAGLIQPYPGARETEPLLLLNRSPPQPDFWWSDEWSEKEFHILSPAEGLVLMLILALVVLPLDRSPPLPQTVGLRS